jgi:hypothetical protein
MHARLPRSVALGFVTAAVLTATIATRAQQGGAPAQRALVPVTAASVALNPDPFYGETVSMTATVEQVLTKTTFSVDQDKTKSTGKEVLVIAPTLYGEVAMNTYVSVVGEVVKFDPAEIAKKAKNYTLDLPADVIEKFRGKPAVIATSVIAPDLADLTKRPMTPDEVALSRIMKQVQPNSGALRTAVAASNLDQTKQNTAALRKNFTDVQAFFKNRGTADATAWAGDMLKLIDATEAAAVAGKWEDAKTSSTSVTQLCTTCHTAHRDLQSDGTSRIKGH